MNKGKERWLALITVIVSLTFSLVLAEVGMGMWTSHVRQKFQDYGDTGPRNGLGPGGLLKENLDIQVTDGYGGSLRWRNNSQGFRSNREFSRTPRPGVLRILSLGDSFMVGYRIPLEKTFSYLLEEKLTQERIRAEVLISLTEHPATALYYLMRFGHTFRPQVVLLGITVGNDIAQTYLAMDPRGEYRLQLQEGRVEMGPNPVASKLGFKHGLERYDLPSAYLVAPAPLDRGFYQVRRWFRNLFLMRQFFQDAEPIKAWYGDTARPKVFDGTHALGMFTRPPLPEVEEAYRRLFLVLEGFQRFTEARGMVFAVLLFPQRFQVQPPDWKAAVQRYHLRPTAFDLKAPDIKIQEFCRKRGILFLDPTPAMTAYYQENKKSLYFPRGDMHWNVEGNRAFFASAWPFLREVTDKARLPGEKDGGQAWDQTSPATPENLLKENH